MIKCDFIHDKQQKNFIKTLNEEKLREEHNDRYNSIVMNGELNLNVIIVGENHLISEFIYMKMRSLNERIITALFLSSNN